MNELQEITTAKKLDQLHKELDFQIGNGELLGGTICSHLLSTMDVTNREFSSIGIKGQNFMTPTILKIFVNNVGFRVEISKGTGFDNETMYGVTFASDSGDILHNLSKSFHNKELAFEYAKKYQK